MGKRTACKLAIIAMVTIGLWLTQPKALATTDNEATPSLTASLHTASFEGAARAEGPEVILTLDDLKELAATRNYASRVEAERIFQARHNVNIAISRLLPSLNLSLAFAVAYQSYIDIIVGSVGFLYPSHWFRWRESKFYFEAERHSFASLLADQVNAVELIYYRIAMVKASAQTYIQYIGLANDIVKRAEAIISDAQVLEQPLRETINFRIALELDLGLILKTINKLHTDLYFAIGLEPKTWSRFSLAPLEFPDISAWPPLIDLEPRYDTVLGRSQELQSLYYLQKGARYSLYARSFDFSMPGVGPDSSLGFGTISSFKIAKSREREVGVHIDETRARLRSTLQKTLVDYNSAMMAFGKFTERLENGKHLFDFLINRLERLHYFDDNIADALNFMVGGDIGRIQAQHMAVAEAANMHRLMWDEPIYERILRIAEAKKPERHLSMWQKMENQKIRTALASGKLDEPAGDPPAPPAPEAEAEAEAEAEGEH